MLVDGTIGFDPSDVVAQATSAEASGYDGIWSAETSHDPFLPLMLAAEHTERIHVGTGIAVAFARNPMTLATTANDLQTASRGRFMLGLGSQIKPHIEKRFSMPWSHPAPRMRELILAIRSIWTSWSDGSRLAFRGEYYRHTLMTPMFDPGPNPYGNPSIYLAAVGSLMTEVAGEVADGLLAHAFTTERYLREVTLPALDRGLAAGGEGPVRLPDLVSRHGGHRARRGGGRRVGGRRPQAAGVLRVHSGVPAGPRAPRLGATCRPNSTPCPSGAPGTT
jgi:probable F420-dependent oxidoreductase